MTNNILDKNGHAEYCPITKSKSPFECMECPYCTGGGTNLNTGISDADCAHGDLNIVNNKDFRLVTNERIISNFDNFIRAAYENGKKAVQIFDFEAKEGVFLSQIVQSAKATPIVEKCTTKKATGFPYFFASETSTDNSTAAIHGKPSLLQRIFKRHEHEKN